MQAEPLFAITDNYELIALHRSLFEAQFTVEPHSRDVPGSPLLASLANRVVDALTQQDPRWSEWRIAANHPDRVQIVRRRLPEEPGWSGMSQAERETHVRNHLAPLIPDGDLLHSLASDAA